MKSRILVATLAVYLIASTGAATAAPVRPPAPPKVEGTRLVADNGVLGLPVAINGVKGALLVDTGCMLTTLRKSDAKALKVNLRSTNRATAGVGGMERTMVGAASMTIPGCRKGAFPTLSEKLDFSELRTLPPFSGLGKTFGVLGLADLYAAGAVVDVGGVRMLLHPRGDYKAPDGFNAMPMIQYAPPGAISFLWVIPVQVGKTRGVMLVDTGAMGTVVTRDFARRVGIPLKKSKIQVGGLGGVGAQGVPMGIIPRMQVGANLNLDQVNVVALDLPALDGKCNGLPVVGILGFDQLDRMKAIMDCKQGVLYATGGPLKANAGLGVPPGLDTNQVLRAIVALAQNGDAEARKMLNVAQRNGGRLELNPQQISAFLARARQKGLIQ